MYDLVAVSGGFDPIHKGHVRMILEAGGRGNVIVILNSDEWLIRKKGYAFMSWEERSEIISAIKGVWMVIKADDSDGTVCATLEGMANSESKPDYFANGGDRKSDNVPEVKLCKELGIEMLWNIGGEKIQSSSELVEKMNEAKANKQQ